MVYGILLVASWRGSRFSSQSVLVTDQPLQALVGRFGEPGSWMCFNAQQTYSASPRPRPRGKTINTDRIDAGYLVQFYANNLLTVIQPPDEEQEQDRDLLPSRQKVLQQRTQLRKHLQEVLRRSGRQVPQQGQSGLCPGDGGLCVGVPEHSGMTLGAK